MPQRRRGYPHHDVLEPAVTLNFDLQNLIRSSVGTSKYSLSVLSKLFKTFIRHRGSDQKTIRDVSKLINASARCEIELWDRLHHSHAYHPGPRDLEITGWLNKQSTNF